MRRLSTLLLLCLLLGVGLPARAEDDPAPGPEEVRAQVATWLRELSADDYETREAARAGLQRLGLQARDLLEAAQDAEDPEVRRTVRALLAAAGGAAPPEAAVRPGDLKALGQVPRLVVSGTVDDALAALGASVGARFELPADGRGRALEVTVGPGPFYDVLDGVLRPAGLRLAQPFDAAGAARLALAPEALVRAPRASYGPTQVTVTEVSATRTLEGGQPPRYAIEVRLDWVPSVQLVQHEQPTIEVARDPQGRAYRPTAAMTRRVSYGVGTLSRSQTLTLHVEPAEAGVAEVLGALEFSVPATMRHDQAVVDIDLDGELPRTVGTDGKPARAGEEGTVRLESVEEVGGARGQWVVELTATLADEAARGSLQAWVLEDDGQPSLLGVYGGRTRSADGTLRLTARAYRRNQGRPKALRVTWFRREEFGTLRYRLEGVPLR